MSPPSTDEGMLPDRSAESGLGPEVVALLDAARDLASTLELRPLLELLLDHLGILVGYTGTAILVLDQEGESLSFAHWRGPESFTGEVARAIRYPVGDFYPAWDRLSRDEPIVIPDVRGEGIDAATFRRLVGEDELDTTYGFIRALMWVPLVVRGRIIGVLSITSPAPNAYGQRDATLALAIARQAAVAIENARLHERAGEAAVLEERQRLARELHDSVSQALFGASLRATAAERALAAGNAEAAAAGLREIGETVREALGEMRLFLFELRPPLLEEQGLAAVLQARLRAVESRAGLVSTFDGECAERLPAELEQELYRLAQEALNNVIKHAHARRVAVRLDAVADRVVLEVVDDGIGFEPTTDVEGFGLPGMRERAARLGATLQVESAPGGGTRIRIEAPR